MKKIYFDTLPIIHKEKETWYTIHRVPKRSGGIHIIEDPSDTVREMQSHIYRKVLLPFAVVSKNAFGCLRGRNGAMLAALHCRTGASVPVLRIDLSECFHSINELMLTEALLNQFHHGTGSVKECGPFSGETIADILKWCTNSRGVLPQGGITSPSLANISMLKLYSALNALAKNAGCVFGGYLDDLIFSGERVRKLIAPATEIIERHGFRVNKRKVSLMRNKKEVLGYTVASSLGYPRLPKKLRKSLRGRVHMIEKQRKEGNINREFFQETLGMVSFGLQCTRDGYMKELHERLVLR